MDHQQVLSTDQLRLQVDAFARYRIVDPLQHVHLGRAPRSGSATSCKPILGSALRNELGRRPFAALLSPERGQMMDNIQNALNRVARQYGAEIVDVRIKRADLPEGTPLESAYRADAHRPPAGGALDPRPGLQAGADHPRRGRRRGGRAPMPGRSTRIPEFYDFYRAMQSYEATFLNAGTGENPRGRSSIILSPNNEYLQAVQGQSLSQRL